MQLLDKSRSRNAAIGLFGGILCGVVFSTITSVIHFVTEGAATRDLGVSLPAAVLLYFAGGALGGIVVGSLWEHTQSRFGATLVLILGLMPVCIGAGMTLGEL